MVSSRAPLRRARDISLVMLSGRRPDPLGWEPRNYGTMEMTSAPLPFLPHLLPPGPYAGDPGVSCSPPNNVATSLGSASAGGVGVNEAG